MTDLKRKPEWWRDKDTMVMTTMSESFGIAKLYAMEIDGVWHYAEVGWYYGAPMLRWEMADGVVLKECDY